MGWIASDEADGLPARDLSAGAGNRSVEQMQSAGRQPLPERGDAVGVACAGAEHDAARAFSEPRQQLALDHVLDLRRVEHGEHDRAAARGQVRHRGRRPGSEIRQPGLCVGIDIAADHLEASGDQALRQCPPEQADAYQPDGGRRRHGSGSMESSPAAASRLSRNARGMGTPCVAGAGALQIDAVDPA